MESHIVNKYNLLLTGKTTGVSFANGLPLYMYAYSRGEEEVYVMECDMEGNPLRHNTIGVYINDITYISVSVEYLFYTPVSEFENTLEMFIKKYKKL